MKAGNIIILRKGETIETWGTLTEICEVHPEFSYHYLKGKKFPFEYKGWSFIKVNHRTKY